MEGGLKVDAAHRGMRDGKVDDPSQFVVVDAAFDRGHKGHV